MQAMSAGSLVAVSSLREFFRDAFHAASEHQRLDIDERLNNTSSTCSPCFPARMRCTKRPRGPAHSAIGAYAGRCPRGAQRRRRASAACSASATYRCSSPASSRAAFARKLIDIDYHIAMGGNAYSSLADTMQRSMSGRGVAAIYAQLAQKFQRLVDALERGQRDVVSAHRRRYLALVRDMDEDRQPAGAWSAQQARVSARQAGWLPARALGSPTTVLRGMQSLLGRLYDVDSATTFTTFWSPTARALGGVAPSNDTRILDEELLLAETADGAGYRCTSIRSVLNGWTHRSAGRIDRGNLADYCTALEGVSHFVYTAWRWIGTRRCRCWNSRLRRKSTSTPPRFPDRPSAGRSLSDSSARRGCSIG
jgi:hypothetical protein